MGLYYALIYNIHHIMHLKHKTIHMCIHIHNTILYSYRIDIIYSALSPAKRIYRSDNCKYQIVGKNTIILFSMSLSYFEYILWLDFNRA